MKFEFDISNLKKSYFGKPALDGINLKIETGSLTFLLGSNGSGKSTLLKCLATHVHWDAGTILRRGADRAVDRGNYNQGLHYISEDIAPPPVPLSELRELYKDLYGKFDDDLFSRFVDLSGLKLTENLTQGSRGQKVQGLLALTLAVHPEVLLIDEATAVLDPYVRTALMRELETLNSKNQMTLILATNIANEITSLKGRLIMLKDGRVVMDRSDEVIDMDEVLRAFERGVS